MIKKLFMLFKIGRKLALSDALNIISKIYKIPILIKIFFSLLALFGKKNIFVSPAPCGEIKISQFENSSNCSLHCKSSRIAVLPL